MSVDTAPLGVLTGGNSRAEVQNPRGQLRGTSHLVSEHGQTSPFRITDMQAWPAQVRPQHSVLFPQERGYRFLLAQDPKIAQGPDEPLERKHRRTLRQPRSILFWDDTRCSVVPCRRIQKGD